MPLAVEDERLATEKTRTSEGATRGDVVAWAIACAFAGLTLVYSLGPVPPATDAFTGADKLLHAGGYSVTVLAFLLAAVWRPGRGRGRFPKAAPWIALAAIAAGALIEVCQGWFFGRDAETADLVADTAGAGLAWIAFAAVRQRRGRADRPA